jgi:ketosteroid isomerase-like protein
MKKLTLMIVLFLLTFIGCKNATTPISDAEKEQIKKEVKEVIVLFVKAANAHDAAAMTANNWNSSEFLYVSNGDLAKGWENNTKIATQIHSDPKYQTFTVDFDEVLMHVISREAVMVTASGKFGNFPVGVEPHDIPLVCTYLFEKKDGNWLITNGHESTNEELSNNGRLDLDSKEAKELDQVWQDYIAASNSGDIEKLMTFVADDYINMPSYNSTQKGKEELKQFMKPFLEGSKPHVNWYRQSEIFVHGKMAYAFGTFEMVNTATGLSGKPILQRCITVFKKDNEGKWKFYRWMGQQ